MAVRDKAQGSKFMLRRDALSKCARQMIQVHTNMHQIMQEMHALKVRQVREGSWDANKQRFVLLRFEFGSGWVRVRISNFAIPKMSKHDGSAKRARAAHVQNSRSGDGAVRELGFAA